MKVPRLNNHFRPHKLAWDRHNFQWDNEWNNKFSGTIRRFTKEEVGKLINLALLR